MVGREESEWEQEHAQAIEDEMIGRMYVTESVKPRTLDFTLPSPHNFWTDWEYDWGTPPNER